MVEIASGWELEVDRGPDWLFVKLRPAGNEEHETPALIDSLWSLLEQHSVRRLVLELDELADVPSCLVEQLVTLEERIAACDGLLRVCGVREDCQETLHDRHPHVHLPHYHDRHQAVMGFRPPQPR
ncbi:MAG: hypothetical protein ACYC35_02455 [Pirellulales bacterium]